MMALDEWEAMPVDDKRQVFRDCLRGEAKSFIDHILEYKSPRLADLQKVRWQACFKPPCVDVREWAPCTTAC
jgi:hypothetical protein